MSVNIVFCIVEDAPNPPTGLQAIAISPKTIRVTWDKPSDDIVAYAVHYRADRR